MTYNKPEVVAVSAINVIEHTIAGKGLGTLFDNRDQVYEDTANAYEADE